MIDPAELRALGLALVRLADALAAGAPGETIDHLTAVVAARIDADV